MTAPVKFEAHVRARAVWAQAHIKERCVEEGDCWLWQGRINPGAPAVQVGGRRYYVRRWLWAALHGAVPKGKEVSVKCTHQWCCAPGCLTLMTRGQIIARSYTTARNSSAEYTKRAAARRAAQPTKLDMEKARAIRADDRATRLIAADYGVTQRTVWKIKQNINWREAANGSSVFAWRPAA